MKSDILFSRIRYYLIWGDTCNVTVPTTTPQGDPNEHAVMRSVVPVTQHGAGKRPWWQTREGVHAPKPGTLFNSRRERGERGDPLVREAKGPACTLQQPRDTPERQSSVVLSPWGMSTGGPPGAKPRTTARGTRGTRGHEQPPRVWKGRLPAWSLLHAPLGRLADPMRSEKKTG